MSYQYAVLHTTIKASSCYFSDQFLFCPIFQEHFNFLGLCCFCVLKLCLQQELLTYTYVPILNSYYVSELIRCNYYLNMGNSF